MSGTAIRGGFLISGLDDDDQVVVEIWTVLDNVLPPNANGNVQSRMVVAQTAATPSDTINVGAQTVPLLKLFEFYTAKADLSISKIDVPNVPLMPLDIFKYVVTVTNTSIDTVSNGVVMTDTLDIYEEFLSVDVYDPGGFGRNCVDPLVSAGGEVFCDLKNLTPQETVPITITILIKSDAPRGSTIETGECTYGDHSTFDLCNLVVVNSTITVDEHGPRRRAVAA